MVSELSADGLNGHVLMVATACFLAFLVAVLSLVGLRHPTSARWPRPRGASVSRGAHHKPTDTTSEHALMSVSQIR